MLELDVWLRGFVDDHYHRLDAGQRTLFAALLAEGDDVLMDWLQAGRRPPQEFCELVEWIRASRGHRP